MGMGLPWFCKPMIVKEWQPFIQAALAEEDFRALALLFQAVADEEHAQQLVDTAWNNRGEDNPGPSLGEAVCHLEQARTAWFSLTAWTQEPSRSPLAAAKEAVEYSSRKHAQRLHYLCQAVNQFRRRCTPVGQ